MLLGLPFDTLAILWLGALLGGIAAGASGFAFGLAASAIWLHRIDPLHSAILITGCGILLHTSTIWPQRKHVDLGRVWPFVLGGVTGVPIGVHFLAHTDAGILKIALGIFLAVFGTYALVAPQAPRHHRRRPRGRYRHRIHRRDSRRPRRLFRCLADDLDAIARLAEGNRPRRLPALRNRHASHHVCGYNVGRIRSRRLDAVAGGACRRSWLEPGSGGSFTAGSMTGAFARRLPCC